MLAVCELVCKLRMRYGIKRIVQSGGTSVRISCRRNLPVTQPDTSIGALFRRTQVYLARSGIGALVRCAYGISGGCQHRLSIDQRRHAATKMKPLECLPRPRVRLLGKPF